MAGEFIWYELVTPDVDAAKAFYDKVVGWNVAASSDFPNGYRMTINLPLGHACKNCRRVHNAWGNR